MATMASSTRGLESERKSYGIESIHDMSRFLAT